MPDTDQAPVIYWCLSQPKWSFESGKVKRQTYKYIIIPWVKCFEGEEKLHVENNNGGGKMVRKCLSVKIKTFTL